MIKFPGELGLERCKKILYLLGNPQEKLKVIHIAGTSGKGSTAYILSSLLQGQGFKTGLHFKPHIYDLRERFQINHQLLCETSCIAYLNDIIPILEEITKSSLGQPTYFETLISLAYYIFYSEKVDYAVIETGMGGMLDGTNVISNPDKISVITRLGLDHTAILGNTKEEIAYQKAKIIHTGNIVISLHQDMEYTQIINDVAKETGNVVQYIQKGVHYDNQDNDKHIAFDFHYKQLQLDTIKLNLEGAYQIENASLALATLEELSQKFKFNIQIKKIYENLSNIQLAGRYQVLTIGKKIVIIDGAHNPQKMESFLNGLESKFPKRNKIFLVAFKKGKDIKQMVEMISGEASQVLITSFFAHMTDLRDYSEDPDVIKNLFESQGFKDVNIQKKVEKAIEYALSQEHPIIVITGSLYLVTEVLKYCKSKFYF
ncbi:MAG: Mur ligase family protein [Candidatus Roizmanbacteria bacterium]